MYYFLIFHWVLFQTLTLTWLTAFRQDVLLFMCHTSWRGFSLPATEQSTLRLSESRRKTFSRQISLVCLRYSLNMMLLILFAACLVSCAAQSSKYTGRNLRKNKTVNVLRWKISVVVFLVILICEQLKKKTHVLSSLAQWKYLIILIIIYLLYL